MEIDILPFFEGYYSSVRSRLVYEDKFDTRGKTQEDFQKEIHRVRLTAGEFA